MAPLTTAARRALAGVLALLLGLLLAGCGDALPRGTASYSGAAAATGSPSDAAQLAPAAPVSGLPTVPVAALPPEAITTLRLIEAGGPFPYSKDGATFSNREGLLPAHPNGWYHEYTVVTPGAGDRGARRIITGDDGARFYTADHYASFREIVSGASS